MNPQYMPQQQFGAPPQAFPSNHPPPSLTPQGGFQNLPLGPQKPAFDTSLQNNTNQLQRGPPAGPPLGQNSFAPPSGALNQPMFNRPGQNAPGQPAFGNFGPGQGPPPQNIPSGQLPPQHKINQPPPMAPPPSQLPPSQTPPSIKTAVNTQNLPPIGGTASNPSGPPTSLPNANISPSSNMPPTSSRPPPSSMAPPSNMQPLSNMPPSLNMSTSNMPPSSLSGNANIFSAPMNQPPVGPPSDVPQTTSSNSMPWAGEQHPVSSPLMMPPGGPGAPTNPPSSTPLNNGYNSAITTPQQQQSFPGGLPPMSQPKPNMSMGMPAGNPHIPLQVQPQPNIGQRPMPLQQQQPMPPQQQQPMPPQQQQPMPPQQQQPFGVPPNQAYMQNGSGLTSPAGLPPKTGQFPPSSGPPNQSMFGGQRAGPPMPGQINPPSQPGMPPAPGNQFGMPPSVPNQFGMPPVPNQFGMPPSEPNQFGAPPMPGQNFGGPGPNQLTNQMQNMNIGGPRSPQYPAAPGGMMKQDNGPHMPPQLSQQAYMNGPQSRGPQSPGYPPMPGQMPGQLPGQMPGQPGVGGYPPQPQYQQPQQARRLDPDQMPSPIQVTQDDQRTRSGVFATNQKGAVPPLVSTSFVVQDQGNASPRFIRSTMYNIPITQDLMKQTAVPFGLIISPMARTVDQEYPPPIVNFGALGPVRCIRCKAYMCPFMQFIDSGRRFQCLFCKATTDVPNEYFQHLDHTGQRVDRYERPELILGTYEFVATTDYCRNNTFPRPPAVIFLIDVSYNNIKSGLVHLLCEEMKEIIKNLPVDQGQDKSNMRVGFITYNSVVHFYNIKGNLAQPQMMVVGDTQEMFMPLLDGFLCTPEESEAVIDSLMQQIPAMFGDTRETETVLLPAIQAGLEALKASECAGKLMVFHSTLPIAEAPGKLKNRDDRKLLGTEKERTVLTPQTQAYNQLGQDCVAVGCSVDLFLFNNAYIDIATIGQVCRLTGGEIFKYTYFQADIDGDRLIQDIITDISRPIAFDSIMRVRTSTGVRPTDFHGHFYMSNTTDMEIAAIDCDKAVSVEVKHDDKLTEEEGVYIQVALLYTSCSGQRRLRVINLALKTCSQMADLYRSCDLDTIVNFFSKQAIYKLNDNNPKVVKDTLVNRSAQILANYRKNCASPSSAGQLILPECMKLLPLYVNCLLKSDALSGGSDITLDDRSFVMQAVTIMDIPTSTGYFYPRLLPLIDLEPTTDLNNIEFPPAIRCSVEKMTDQGVYLLENGIHMFLWIGIQANPEWVQQVFGVPSAAQVDIDRIHLPILENSLNATVRALIDQLRIQRHRHMRLTLVRQREKLEPVFKHFLVEDRGQDGSPSYVDFLCHMHKEIRALLS